MNATFTTSELNDVLPALRRFALSLTRNQDRADDLVQDSVERALVKAHHFEPGSNLRSWMFTLCRRVFLNQIRKQKTQGASVELDDAPQACVAADPIQDKSMECSDVVAGFHRLPMRDKVVLSLIAIEGLKYEEAAQVLDIPVGTVRSRLSRARTRLKEMVDAGDEDREYMSAA